MATNLSPILTPITNVFSGLLISDTTAGTNNQPGNSADALAQMTTITANGITQTVSAALEVQSQKGALLLPRMSTTARDNLIQTPGMMIYNTDAAALEIKEATDWISIDIGNGNVVGPNGAVTDNIPIFADTTGLLLKDSGVGIQQVTQFQELRSTHFNALNAKSHLKNAVPLAPSATVNQIDQLGVLAYTGGLGSIYIDLLPVAFLWDNNAGAGSDFGSSSIVVFDKFTGDSGIQTTESAILELQGTNCALLVTRMTTTQMNAIGAPSNGMIIYNTTTGTFWLYQNNAWAENGTGAGSGTVTSVNVVPGLSSTALTTSGGPITSSGNITIDISSELQALSTPAATGFITRTGTNAYSYRHIVGTSGQINVINQGGTTGNPQISIADNGVAPGSYESANITVDSTGRITAASNGGTAVLSGAWTPNVTFGFSSSGVTYAARQGFYRVVGPMVFVQGFLVLSSKGTSTGQLIITGLPYGMPDTGGNFGRTYMNLTGSFTALQFSYGLVYPDADPYMYCYKQDNFLQQLLTDADMQDNSILAIQGSYFIS